MRFEHPHLLWLLAVLPPLIMLFWWWSQRVRRRLLSQFVQARLLPELTVGLSTARQRARAWLFSGAAGLMIVALARPQWGFTWEEARQKGLDIVVAIDTSKSMLAEDIKPDRLTRAKLAALDLMQQARADRLGVVAFAGGAFLQCPLTLDDGAFRQCIDALNVNIIPQGGTALAEAIRTATQAFKNNDNFKVLVLFTDGEDHDAGALEAATEAAAAGMRIFTVGLGTDEGEILRIRDDRGRVDYVRDNQGQVVKSRLNEAILQQIAGAAQGFYLPLRGADTVDTLYRDGLAHLPKSEFQTRLFQHYHEQYHWFLGLALLLLLIETLLPERRRESAQPRGTNMGAVATVGALLLWSGSDPALASPGSAVNDYNAGDYRKALEEFDRLREKHGEDSRLHYNAGAAAFRAGQYDDALQRFSLATGAADLTLQQLAYYNRGNAFYRSGEEQSELPKKRQAWEKAIQDYEAALKLNGEDPDAQFNRDFVKKRLEELEQQQQNQKDQQKQQPDQKDQQDQQQQQQDQQQGQQDKSDQPQQQKQQQEEASQSEQQSAEQQEPQQQQGTQEQQGSGQEGEPEQQDGQPVAPGTLTPEQARRLLDAQKGDEQMLPVQLLSPQPRQPPAKDW